MSIEVNKLEEKKHLHIQSDPCIIEPKCVRIPALRTMRPTEQPGNNNSIFIKLKIDF